MALKTISYTVDSAGLTPKVRQDGGIQGDHKKTQLEFTLREELWAELQTEANAAEGLAIYYRFDQYNGEGGCESTVPQELVNNAIVFPLEEWITRYGGIIKVVLVLTVGDSETTLTELYSFPAMLSLRSRPTGSEPDEKQYQSMSLMSAATLKAAEEAKASAMAADLDRQKTELARAALEGEWIFDGESEIGIDLAVDSEMSDVSENPVKNKAIKEYVDTSIESLKEMYKVRIVESGSVANDYECTWYYKKYNDCTAEIFGRLRVASFDTEGQCSDITKEFYDKETVDDMVTSNSITVNLPFRMKEVVVSGSSATNVSIVNVISGREKFMSYITFAVRRMTTIPGPYVIVYLNIKGLWV